MSESVESQNLFTEVGNFLIDDLTSSSNLPPFAGEGIPSFMGDDGRVLPTPTSPPDGNNNQTNSNSNWYFSDGNLTDGNGNWYFGGGNVTTGNGNWYLGNNNNLTGNGNRPSGDGNSITGNGNRPSGDNNSITGNRVLTTEDGQTIFGNGDRFFLMDANGNVSLISDESASDPDYEFDLENDNETTDSTVSMNIDSFSMMNGFGDGTGSNPFGDDSAGGNPFGGGTEGGDNTDASDNSEILDQLRRSPFGRLFEIPGFEIDDPSDIFGDVGGEGGNPFGDNTGGGNPFSGNTGGDNPFAGGGENPFGGMGNPFEGEALTFEVDGDNYLLKNSDNQWYLSDDDMIDENDQLLFEGNNVFGGENPFGDGENPFGGMGNPFEGQEVTISIPEDGYLLKDADHQWYLSEDDMVDEADELLYGGSNPFTGSGDGDNPSPGDNFGNPFAGEEGQELAISIPGDGYLLKDADNQWYLSEDDRVTENDQLLFEGVNAFSGGSGSFGDGDNPFGSDGNSFGGGENPFAGGGENPFSGGGNPFA